MIQNLAFISRNRFIISSAFDFRIKLFCNSFACFKFNMVNIVWDNIWRLIIWSFNNLFAIRSKYGSTLISLSFCDTFFDPLLISRSQNNSTPLVGNWISWSWAGWSRVSRTWESGTCFVENLTSVVCSRILFSSFSLILKFYNLDFAL